jgi:hypothetical protein
MISIIHLYITIGSRATTLCSAILPIVYTLTSTNLSTLLTGHCTYLWMVQNISLKLRHGDVAVQITFG